MWRGYLVRLLDIMVAMIGAPHGRIAFQVLMFTKKRSEWSLFLEHRAH